ncbi:MAG: hypothetical protein GEV12_06915 [Micromonosporaceae bacterium]|nr:hypothetical protein [Micromonosporaceae bacterium]
MEDWITGVVAVLGTLMVLAGATLIVLRTLGRLGGPAAEPDATPTAPRPGAPATSRWQALRRLSPATQLIGWGVVLLVVAAFTVGLISFGINLEAGTQ